MISKFLQIQTFFSITRTIFSHSRSEKVWYQNTITIFQSAIFQNSKHLIGFQILLAKALLQNFYVQTFPLRSFILYLGRSYSYIYLIVQKGCAPSKIFLLSEDVQDRKTNSFVCFLGEFAAQQFCFEIYWPLDNCNKIKKTKFWR